MTIHQYHLQMRLRAALLIIVLALAAFACEGQGKLGGVLKKAAVGKPSPGGPLSNEEVIRGLKEALVVGTSSASSLAGRVNGFYKNPSLFIPWPEEAQAMKERLIRMGFQDKVNEFELSLNRAAEDAAARATPVFTQAIMGMGVQDGIAILKGNDTAATHYLRATTTASLHEQFLPVVQEAIKKVNVTKYWHPLVSAYNLIPGVTQQNPDLDEYVTGKTINGLMLLIGEEEKKIRKDPAARVTALLKKVFG